MLTLESYGAAGTVTGSLHIFTYESNGEIFRFGIDAGMFQTGEHVSEVLLNSNLGFDPSTIDSWILTHAHLDHTGRLPYVVKRGYSGKIFATSATQRLASIVMFDAAKQMVNKFREIEHDEYATIQAGKIPTHNFEQKDVELYNDADIEKTISRFVTHNVGSTFNIHANLEVTFFEASHILGSVYLKIRELSTGKVVFHSADLGFSPKPFLKKITSQQPEEKLEAIIMESTYGDRLHTNTDPRKGLTEHLKSTLSSGGTVIIPSFAIQRSQELLYYCTDLMSSGQIPKCKVYLDSPMASAASEVYGELIPEVQQVLASPMVQQLITPDQSKELNYTTEPCIIIAGSGMMNGGRVWQHLRFHGSQSKNLLCIVGYQAPGTHGDEVMNGKRDFIIGEKDIHLGCKIVKIDGFSGHADQAMLTKWCTDLLPQSVIRGTKDCKLILIHGEDPSRHALSEVIQGKVKSATFKVILPVPAEKHILFH